MMFLSAATGFALFLGDFPLWRIIVVIAMPAMMGALEMTFVRRIRPEDFDRAYMKVATFGLLIIGLLVAITNGLRGPMAPILLLAAVMPLFIFGGRRFVYWQQLRVLVLLGIIGFLPDEVLGPPLTKEAHAAIMILTVVSSLIILTMRVRQFLTATRLGLEELDRMREERLAEAEERLQRMQSVSSRIAHELKNPLAAIKSLVQLTKKSSAEKDQERLSVVEDEVARMELILKDYLSFSRPLDDLKIALTEVADAVADVREILAARAENADVNLELHATPVAVHADARRLKEALINLVSNAIEATPAQGTVSIVCSPTASGAQMVVRDTGRGMSAEALLRLGTPYFTTRAEGTGLGVHLARGVVAQHGGTVNYASTVGVGTTVTISLPAQPPGMEPKCEAEVG